MLVQTQKRWDYLLFVMVNILLIILGELVEGRTLFLGLFNLVAVLELVRSQVNESRRGRGSRLKIKHTTSVYLDINNIEEGAVKLKVPPEGRQFKY